jgi:hypothetical protein
MFHFSCFNMGACMIGVICLEIRGVNSKLKIITFIDFEPLLALACIFFLECLVSSWLRDWKLLPDSWSTYHRQNVSY